MHETTSPARILIVEDESLVAAELQDRLSKLDYEVVALAATAEEAVAEASRNAPDLVLMDIRLRGEGDGIDAAERIYDQFGLPIVYLTAYSDDATIRRARSTKPFGYVLKPFQQKDLVISIEMALQRHACERALQASERRYATTLESIGDGVVATDRGARVTFMNPSAEELSGWNSEDAVGREIEEVLPLEHQDVAGENVGVPVRRALETGEVVRLPTTMQLRTRSGELRLVEDSAAPIRDTRGDLLGAVMAFRDCTQRVTSEAELARARVELQRKRTLESLGELAGGVAHDFNNALTAMLGSAELLKRRVPDRRRDRELIDTILDSGQRAAALTRQLMLYGRREMTSPVVADLNALIRELGDRLKRDLGELVSVRFDLCDDATPVLVEPPLLEQVVLNLCTNARDAMGELGGPLHVETHLVPEADGRGAGLRVELRVTDRGCGMDAETLERVFEPFFTTKQLGNGNGLGLASAASLAKQFGGELRAASTLGLGSTFTLELPLAALEALPGVDPDADDSSLHGTESLLLVEDDDAVRTVTATGLRAYGYGVAEATDGPSAVREYGDGEGFDLVVADLELRGWNGTEVVRLLRARRPELRVLYVSGYSSSDDVRTRVKEGRMEFLRKPFTPAALARRVRELLDG